METERETDRDSRKRGRQTERDRQKERQTEGGQKKDRLSMSVTFLSIMSQLHRLSDTH